MGSLGKPNGPDKRKKGDLDVSPSQHAGRLKVDRIRLALAKTATYPRVGFDAATLMSDNNQTTENPLKRP